MASAATDRPGIKPNVMALLLVATIPWISTGFLP